MSDHDASAAPEPVATQVTRVAPAEKVARFEELLGDAGGGEVRTVDGWEGWFVEPGYAPPEPPRRWKMAAITLAAL